MTAIFVSKESRGVLATLTQILRTMVKNPLLQSVVAGLVFASSGLTMPLVLDRTIEMLANAAAPAALFALGATLYGQPIKSAFAEISSISVLKLVVHPVLVASLFLLIPGVDLIWVKVAIIAACLPVAANVFMLSQFYNSYSGRTASAILASTVLASITTPITLYLVFQLN